MEQKLGTDLSGVRVHEGTDPLALDAAAYARGRDVHFAPGFYRPHTTEGQRMLGHELTHVAQQSRGSAGPTGQVAGETVNDRPELEREADDQSRQSVGPGSPAVPGDGGPPTVSGASGGAVIQRLRLDQVPDAGRRLRNGLDSTNYTEAQLRALLADLQGTRGAAAARGAAQVQLALDRRQFLPTFSFGSASSAPIRPTTTAGLPPVPLPNLPSSFARAAAADNSGDGDSGLTPRRKRRSSQASPAPNLQRSTSATLAGDFGAGAGADREEEAEARATTRDTPTQSAKRLKVVQDRPAPPVQRTRSLPATSTPQARPQTPQAPGQLQAPNQSPFSLPSQPTPVAQLPPRPPSLLPRPPSLPSSPFSASAPPISNRESAAALDRNVSPADFFARFASTTSRGPESFPRERKERKSPERSRPSVSSTGRTTSALRPPPASVSSAQPSVRKLGSDLREFAKVTLRAARGDNQLSKRRKKAITKAFSSKARNAPVASLATVLESAPATARATPELVAAVRRVRTASEAYVAAARAGNFQSGSLDNPATTPEFDAMDREVAGARRLFEASIERRSRPRRNRPIRSEPASVSGPAGSVQVGGRSKALVTGFSQQDATANEPTGLEIVGTLNRLTANIEGRGETVGDRAFVRTHVVDGGFGGPGNEGNLVAAPDYYNTTPVARETIKWAELEGLRLLTRFPISYEGRVNYGRDATTRFQRREGKTVPVPEAFLPYIPVSIDLTIRKMVPRGQGDGSDWNDWQEGSAVVQQNLPIVTVQAARDRRGDT